MKDDLIRRSDAIGAITNHCENECYYRVDNWCPQCQREEFEEVIKAVPSADRPQGEWIEHKERTIVRNGNFVDFFPTEYECSNCGLRRATYFIDSPLSNYCPNCGARMKGADDETD